MTNVIFTKQTGERVLQATRQVEGRADRLARARRERRLPAQMYPVWGVIQADVAANANVNVRLLEGTVGSEAVPGSGYEEINAHNILPRKLFDDSEAILVWTRTKDSGGKWRIIWSNSASRIQGTTASAINAASSGTLNTLQPVDGVYGGSTITAHNVLTNYTIPSGVVAWAEWSCDNNQWEIYAADCAS